jgi:glycosyltransferase involved in cell wall biosynthesis
MCSLSNHVTDRNEQSDRPRISVALCTYNGSRFLDEQLASIREQERPPDELVVCDDCSGDATVAKLEKFARDSTFPVRVVVNRTRLGSTKNYSEAIALCNGEIIALSDQDDIWNKMRLRKTEEVFIRRPSAGMLFSDADLIEEDSSPAGVRLWKSVRFGYFQRLLLQRDRAAQALLRHNVVTGATMAFRSSLREIVLPIPDIWIHDGWIALLASFFSEIVALNDPLIQYRRHRAQQVGVSPSLRSQIARAKSGSLGHYSLQAEQYEIAHQRLHPYARTEKQKEILRCLTGKVRHSLTRARMPEHRIARIPLVTKEFVTMRYTLYSRGLTSAIRDLLIS